MDVKRQTPTRSPPQAVKEQLAFPPASTWVPALPPPPFPPAPVILLPAPPPHPAVATPKIAIAEHMSCFTNHLLVTIAAIVCAAARIITLRASRIGRGGASVEGGGAFGGRGL